MQREPVGMGFTKVSELPLVRASARGGLVKDAAAVEVAARGCWAKRK